MILRQIGGNVMARWIVLALGLVCAAPAAADNVFPAVFGAREVRHADLSAFHKWTGMLDRRQSEQQLPEGDCGEKRLNKCHVREWRATMAELSGKDRLSQIEGVNGFLNRVSYVTDPVNWGLPDYWATPLQFLRKEGDCEDYAIAKFLSLKALGFTNDDMRIVVLDDLNLRVPHAVLVVRHEGRLLLLDNQVRGVVPVERIRHYKPIFSINEEAWWLHR